MLSGGGGLLRQSSGRQPVLVLRVDDEVLGGLGLAEAAVEPEMVRRRLFATSRPASSCDLFLRDLLLETVSDTIFLKEYGTWRAFLFAKMGKLKASAIFQRPSFLEASSFKDNWCDTAMRAWMALALMSFLRDRCVNA